MKKLLVLFATMLFAAVAVAQTCDLTMGPMVASYKGKVTFEEKGQVYHNITPAEAQQIVVRSQQVLDTASKVQDKGGDYSLTFDGSTTCSGITLVQIPVFGMTHKALMRVLRQAYGPVAEGHIQQSEKHVANGGKGPWGKE